MVESNDTRVVLGICIIRWNNPRGRCTRNGSQMYSICTIKFGLGDVAPQERILVFSHLLQTAQSLTTGPDSCFPIWGRLNPGSADCKKVEQHNIWKHAQHKPSSPRPNAPNDTWIDVTRPLIPDTVLDYTTSLDILVLQFLLQKAQLLQRYQQGMDQVEHQNCLDSVDRDQVQRRGREQQETPSSRARRLDWLALPWGRHSSLARR
jgi:hypothetical protein